MIWFRDLLLGIFTRHLGTKLLSLLLSLGLFGFVQASLRATHEIRQLTLQFSLVPQLRNEWVLLNDEITFNNLLISGMRAKVDPLAKLYAGKPTVKLEIDQRFLNRYGEREDKKIRVRVTRDLLAEDALLGRDVSVGEFAEPVIELDKVDSKEARVEIDVSRMPATITKENHEYENTKLNLSVNLKSVLIEGPASAFTAEPVILVSVPKIEDELSKVQVTGERGEARLSKVEIGWKGIATDLLPRLRISTQDPGGEQLSVQDFRKRLVISCEVTKKKVEKILQDLPIEIRYPLPRKFDLVEDYGAYGGAFLDTDLKDGRKQELKVRLPRSLAGNQAFLDNLVVVLNVGEAQEDPATKGTLLVPYRLDLKDRGREQDVPGLALVDIVPSGGAAATQALAEFRKKE